MAGIVAARGSSPTGVRGLAPGVSLLVYRVVPKNSELASNFAIAKAIDLAVESKADLINLSIEGVDPDPLVRQAIERARAGGSVLVAAAGNGIRFVCAGRFGDRPEGHFPGEFAAGGSHPRAFWRIGGRLLRRLLECRRGT